MILYQTGGFRTRGWVPDTLWQSVCQGVPWCAGERSGVGGRCDRRQSKKHRRSQISQTYGRVSAGSKTHAERGKPRCV